MDHKGPNLQEELTKAQRLWKDQQERSVPEGYFDTLSQKIMERHQHECQPERQTPVQRLSKVWISVAASLVLLTCAWIFWPQAASDDAMSATGSDVLEIYLGLHWEEAETDLYTMVESDETWSFLEDEVLYELYEWEIINELK